jgi:hypothetical protein
MLAKHREPAKNEIEVAAIASLRNISVARRANGAGSGLGRLRSKTYVPERRARDHRAFQGATWLSDAPEGSSRLFAAR